MTRRFAHTAAALVLTLTTAATATPTFAEETATPAEPLSTFTAAVTITAPAPRATRPHALPALYASYAALNLYDVVSTKQALAKGAVEGNGAMTGVVGNTAAFVGVKAGLVVGTTVLAEHLWKRNNKLAAVAVMVASNSVAALVAANNSRVLRQLR